MFQATVDFLCFAMQSQTIALPNWNFQSNAGDWVELTFEKCKLLSLLLSTLVEEFPMSMIVLNISDDSVHLYFVAVVFSNTAFWGDLW